MWSGVVGVKSDFGTGVAALNRDTGTGVAGGLEPTQIGRTATPMPM